MIRKILLSLALSVIGMFFFTKWWLLASGEVVLGFPYIYTIRCGHTSLCDKFFIKNILIDFSLYLTLSFTIVSVAQRLLPAHKVFRWIGNTVIAVGVIFSVGFGFWLGLPDHLFYWEQKQEHNLEVIDTGISVGMQDLIYHKHRAQ